MSLRRGRPGVWDDGLCNVFPSGQGAPRFSILVADDREVAFRGDSGEVQSRRAFVFTSAARCQPMPPGRATSGTMTRQSLIRRASPIANTRTFGSAAAIGVDHSTAQTVGWHRANNRSR
jgi:hypothetical protein